MSWLGVAITLIAVSSSSVAPSRGNLAGDLPLSDQELLLLEAAEADSSSVSDNQKSVHGDERDSSVDDPAINWDLRKVYPQKDARGISLSEVIAHSHLPIRFVRRDPGRLQMLYQGQAGHRFPHTLDGTPLRHLFNSFDETGALSLIDPQSISELNLVGQKMLISRQQRNYAADSDAFWKGNVWLQGGSFLRDFVSGARIDRLSPQSSASLHIATAQPSSGYLASNQETKRHNASVRINYDGDSKFPMNWEIGADFDQLRDFVRWDLNAQGNTIDRLQERLGAFAGGNWRSDKLQLRARIHHYRYQNQRSLNSNDNSLGEKVQQSGGQLTSNYELLDWLTLAANLHLNREAGSSELDLISKTAENNMLIAGLSGIAKWGDFTRNKGQLYVKAEHAIQELIDGGTTEGSQYQSVDLHFVQAASSLFAWHTQAIYRPRLPSIADLGQGAEAMLESLWRINFGPELRGPNWNIKLTGFLNWYENRIQRDLLRSNIIQLDKDKQQGLVLSGHWNWTEHFGLGSYVVVEKEAGQNNQDVLYSQFRLHYLYTPRNIYMEANIKQLDLEVFTANLFFRVPLGDIIEAQIIIDNMFDLEIQRPESSLPEPELNVRAAIKAHW